MNTSEFTYAAVQLSEKLLKIVEKTPGNKKTNERMFINLFDYIQSDEYIHLWTTVTAAASTTPSRLLYYYVTTTLYKTLLFTHKPVNHTSDTCTSDFTYLTPDEQGALKYVAGYLIRNSVKKAMKQNQRNKETIVYSLYCFLEDPEETQDQQELPQTILEWCRIVDRGGLFHCTNEFTHFLTSVETVTKSTMKRGNEKLFNIALLKQTLLQDHAVSSWWSTLRTQGDINDDKISADLLNSLLTDYINLRGFAFAARWMEMYKTENKKVIDKTKGLRTKLQTSLD